MTELELKRVAGERRLYAVESLGTLRLEGITSRAATAQAAGNSWRIARRHLWMREIEATDAAGATVGSFKPHGLRRGGSLRWAGRDLELRPASTWRERYALTERRSELAVLDAKAWGRQPVTIRIDEPAAVEAGLLLFAAFVVRGLAEDASGAAGAGAGAVATGG